ncbi:glycoside hydrolase family 5 protein [Xylariales sp. AK1849]|nr:glycoside hydrolase family 5 protein [Xylariales sp. AK1849]
MRSVIILGSTFAGVALAQVAAYAQCGGSTFTGTTTCVSGYTCVATNEYYSQCVPGSAVTSVVEEATSTTLATSTVAATATTAAASATSTAAAGKLKWFGINQSVAEFGSGTYPGTYGVDFSFPSTDTLATLIGEGYNIFRIAFAMERLVPDELTGTTDAAYLANLTTVVDFVTNKGAYAILDPHNFGRYYSNIITDTDGFGSFWTTVATAFASNGNVIFDTNNEYHDMDQDLVLNLNQAAINGIRAAGATSQYIFAEGNSYTGAWTWNTTNTNLAALTDPEDKLIYEMHQYLDSDGSGTAEACVSTTIGVERVIGATEWLRENGKLGIIGEFAGGANADCKAAITGLLNHLADNSDVWQGALWWAGGPWWADYIFSFEPPSGTAYVYYDSLLQTYTP